MPLLVRSPIRTLVLSSRSWVPAGVGTLLTKPRLIWWLGQFPKKSPGTAGRLSGASCCEGEYRHLLAKPLTGLPAISLLFSILERNGFTGNIKGWSHLQKPPPYISGRNHQARESSNGPQKFNLPLLQPHGHKYSGIPERSFEAAVPVNGLSKQVVVPALGDRSCAGEITVDRGGRDRRNPSRLR